MASGVRVRVRVRARARVSLAGALTSGGHTGRGCAPGERRLKRTPRSVARRRCPRPGAAFGQLACSRRPPRPQPPLPGQAGLSTAAGVLSNAAEACSMGRQSAPKTGTLVKRNLPKKMPSVIGNRYTAAANARSIGSTASSAIRTAAVAARVGWRSGACTERAGDKARAGANANAYAGAHTSASTMHDVRIADGLRRRRTVSEVQGGSRSGHASDEKIIRQNRHRVE